MLIGRFTVRVLAVGMMAAGSAACGQNFPSKPIRIVTGGVGGNSDFSARIIAQGLTPVAGQQVIVENRGGAAVVTGQVVAKATPDGYTLLLAGGTFTIGDLLTKVPYPYRWDKDFLPVSLTNSAPNVLVVPSAVPAKSVKELIALARAKPGELNYSTGETGSTSQLAAELFKSMSGVKITGIHYSSGSVRMADLIGGRVQMEFATLGSVAPYIKTDKLRALGLTSAQPSALMPGLSTIAAGGVPGYEAVSMAGIFAPANTPAAIINRLNQDIVHALARPEVKQAFFSAGIETVGSAPQEYAARVSVLRDRVTRMIKAGDIVVE